MDTQKWFEISNEVKTILVWQIIVEKENQFTPNNKTANGGNERSDYYTSHQIRLKIQVQTLTS